MGERKLFNVGERVKFMTNKMSVRGDSTRNTGQEVDRASIGEV